MKKLGSFQSGALEKKRCIFMKAKDLDKLFDSGEVDITPYLELSEGYRPDQEQ